MNKNLIIVRNGNIRNRFGTPIQVVITLKKQPEGLEHISSILKRVLEKVGIK